MERSAAPGFVVVDDDSIAGLFVAEISCSRSTAAASTASIMERHGCMQQRSSHDRRGGAFVGVVGVGMLGVGASNDAIAVGGVGSGGCGGINGGGGCVVSGASCVDGVGAAGSIGAAGGVGIGEAPAPHDVAAALPPSPICTGGSLSAFSAFSALRTSLVAAPSSGCCSRSLASRALTPISGYSSRRPRTAS